MKELELSVAILLQISPRARCSRAAGTAEPGAQTSAGGSRRKRKKKIFFDWLVFLLLLAILRLTVVYRLSEDHIPSLGWSVSFEIVIVIGTLFPAALLAVSLFLRPVVPWLSLSDSKQEEREEKREVEEEKEEEEKGGENMNGSLPSRLFPPRGSYR